jgi:hypothetical protein
MTAGDGGGARCSRCLLPVLMLPLEPIARAKSCPDPVPLLGTLEFGSGREGAGACRILTLAR